jgi:putative flippase GtrA
MMSDGINEIEYYLPMKAKKILLRNSLSRFISVGAVNTCFSYFSTIIIFHIFSGFYSTWNVAIISTVANIFFSFNTNYFFVFKKKKYLQSMIKAFVVYSMFALFSVLLLTLFIDYAMFNIWVSQFLNLCVIIPIMFLVHQRFTYQ